MKSHGLKLNRAYSISFDSSIVGKFFWSLILKDCIKEPAKKRKLVFLCSRPRQIVKLGTYMFVVVRRRLRNVQKRVVHVQNCYLPKKPLLFCCSRCRRRCRCLRSLFCRRGAGKRVKRCERQREKGWPLSCDLLMSPAFCLLPSSTAHLLFFDAVFYTQRRREADSFPVVFYYL